MNNETSADIIREMRDPNSGFCRWYADGGSCDCPKCAFDALADRLEAAAKREIGNNAAMRKALIVAKANLDSIGASALEGELNPDAVAMICAKISARIESALAAPARNCDVGTAVEQAERFKHYCGQHYSACDVDAECFRCPLASEATSGGSGLNCIISSRLKSE